MKERSIIFNADMVRAILAGRKTQTRRLARQQPAPQQGAGWSNTITRIDSNVEMEFYYVRSEPVDGSYENGWEWKILETAIPPCAPGDRLWVRETWMHSNWPDGPAEQDCAVFYRADYLDDPLGPDLERSPDGIRRKWLPSIHMPRWASRIMLEVTGVRVQRLQDISAKDAIAEGVENTGEFFGCPCWRDYMEPDPELSSFPGDPVGSYASLWESIHGPKSWDQNPWVWVIEFRRVKQ